MASQKALAALALSVLCCVAVFVVLDDSNSYESIHASKLPDPAADDSVIRSIVDLKAFCIEAKKILATNSEFQGFTDLMKNSVVSFIDTFGKTDSKYDVVTEYANAYGTVKASHPVGMGAYMLTELNQQVLAGKDVVSMGRSRHTKGYVLLNHFSTGLSGMPRYFKLMKVNTQKFAAAKVDLHAGKGGKAIKTWMNLGKANVYKEYLAKINAKYLALDQGRMFEVEEGAKAAVRASFQEGVKKGHGPQQVVVPLPVAGKEGALLVHKTQTFKMPSAAAMKKEAMEEAIKYMESLAKRNLSVTKVVDYIEAEETGTRIKMHTANKDFADSVQTPTIKITGENGIIKAYVDALPLGGEGLAHTYKQKSGESVGKVKSLLITADPSMVNPWLCSGVEVQEGHGMPITKFYPIDKNGEKVEKFWLDKSEGESPEPYGKIPTKKSWTLYPGGKLPSEPTK